MRMKCCADYASFYKPNQDDNRETYDPQGGVMRTVAAFARLLCGLVAATVLAAPSFAHEDTRPCVGDAKGEMQLCKAACKETFRAEKDLCRNVDHDCADACRAGLEVCILEPVTELQDCKDKECNDPLEAAKAQCRQQFPPETPERDKCIDAAQVVAFQCRDACREGVRDELKLCRKALRACIKACPPAEE